MGHAQQRSFSQSPQVGIETAGSRKGRGGSQPAASGHFWFVQQQYRSADALGRGEAAQGGAAQAPGQS
ncbi:hypothetical protein, partial [Hymenobacter agri]